MQRDYQGDIKENLIRLIKQNGSCFGIACHNCYFYKSATYVMLCETIDEKERFEERLQLANKFLREEKLNRICKENSKNL